MTEAIETKERPILFRGPMVRAILDGRKTQTRRVLTFNNSTVLGYTGKQGKYLWDKLVWNDNVYVDGGCDPFGPADSQGYQYLHVPAIDDGEEVSYRVRPRIEPGDRLWVRESFRLSGGGYKKRVVYRCDGKLGDWFPHYGPLNTNQRPSIHMPRWASRATLEVARVRVERVQDISRVDIMAEGCPIENVHKLEYEWFQLIWDAINAKRGFPWESNPWVWVVDFEVT